MYDEGISQSEIARRLGVSRQAIHYHLKQAGTEKHKKDGRSRSKRYYDKHPKRRRESQFRFKYGIELKDALALKRVDGNCTICKRRPGTHFDHHHKTGKHRGWLCQQCNTGLGMFKENIDILLSATDYIRKTNPETS